MSFLDFKHDDKKEKIVTFVAGILVGVLLISVLFYFIGPKKGTRGNYGDRKGTNMMQLMKGNRATRDYSGQGGGNRSQFQGMGNSINR